MRPTSGVLVFNFIIDRGNARDAKAGRDQAKTENNIKTTLRGFLHLHPPQKGLGYYSSGDINHTGKDYTQVSDCEVGHNKG